MLRARLEPQVLQGLLELQARLVLQVLLEPLEQRGLQVLQARLVLRVQQVLLVQPLQVCQE